MSLQKNTIFVRDSDYNSASDKEQNECAVSEESESFFLDDSAYVSIEEAQIELEQILSDLYATPNKALVFGEHRVIDDTFSMYPHNEEEGNGLNKSLNSELPFMHIINFKNNAGFALMSASKHSPSLLALALCGHFDNNKPIDNPGLKEAVAFLEKKAMYEERIEAPVDYYHDVSSEWENIIYHGDGLCSVKWRQKGIHTICFVQVLEESVLLQDAFQLRLLN